MSLRYEQHLYSTVVQRLITMLKTDDTLQIQMSFRRFYVLLA